MTFPGGPLIVSVGSLGQCQSSYSGVGVNFYPPTGTLGDCGFLLSFPASSPNPAALQQAGAGTVFGFEGAAGPHMPTVPGGVTYTPIAQFPTTGSGIAADPYLEATSFKAEVAGLDYALINVFTYYVEGAPQFTSLYEVQNVTGTANTSTLTPAPAATLFFHATAAGDLYVANSDFGRGFYQEGPSDFIGGQNAATGTVGGFVAAPPPALPWTNFEVGGYTAIWESVLNSTTSAPVFADTINTNLIDNAVGVSWDQYLVSGLAAGQRTSFSVVNRAQVPSTLDIQPAAQTLSVGQTATITIKATDNVGTPYADRSLVYSLSGANPKSGSVTTSTSGVATISYVGTSAGLDKAQVFLDLPGTGVPAAQDPTASAEVIWAPQAAAHGDPGTGAGPGPQIPHPGVTSRLPLVGPIQMYFAGLTVPGHPGRLRLKRIVLLGARAGESLSIRCHRCLGASKSASKRARGGRVVFTPKALTITRRSRLAVSTLAPGMIGRFKVYGIDIATASAKPLQQGCLGANGSAHIRCPS